MAKDRGYNDYGLFFQWTAEEIYFVTRLKENATYDVVEELAVPQDRNIRSDQLIRFTGVQAQEDCPCLPRRVVVWDPVNEREIVLLTNPIAFGVTTIAAIYKDRREIELFFQALQQNLKVKSFVGTSENALRIQTWTALIAILLLKWLHHLSKAKWSLSKLASTPRLNLRQREEHLPQVSALSPERLIFLDESGVTTSLTRLRAPSEGGGRIAEATPGGRWKMMTILGAVSVRGMVAAMTIEEATDGDIFLAFVDRVLCRAPRPGDIVVLDNLGSHEAVRVRERIERAGAQLLYLPPYPPDLNPIEKAWSKLKQLLRSATARGRGALEAAIAGSLPHITPDNATAWFRGCGLIYGNS